MERASKILHTAYTLIFSLYAPIFIVYVIANYVFFQLIEYLDQSPVVRAVLFVLGAAVIFSIFGFLIILSVRYYRDRRARELYGCPHVKLLSSDVSLTCKPDSEYLFERRISIQALETGVSEFYTRFDYRGAENDFHIVDSEGAKFEISRPLDNLNYNVYMNFSPALKKGEKRELKFIITIRDKNLNMGPFFGHFCSLPAQEYIRQDVIFDGVPIPAQVRSKIYETSYTPVGKTEQIPVVNRRISHVIKNPKLGYRYVLEWS